MQTQIKTCIQTNVFDDDEKETDSSQISNNDCVVEAEGDNGHVLRILRGEEGNG